MRTITFLFLSILSIQSYAQVLIPDVNLKNKLKSLQYYAPCFNGDVLDTIAAANVSNYDLEIKDLNIANLEGIQYFKQLSYLRCDSNKLTSITKLPPLLNDFSCRVNQISVLTNLPSSLSALDCEGNLLSALPAQLPSRLLRLVAGRNNLTTLPSLPSSLTLLNCNGNKLTQLPELENTQLFFLFCAQNELTTLPAMPGTLATLNCHNNKLNYLPLFPASLTSINCTGNNLEDLPGLPPNLSFLQLKANPFTCLPALPGSLTFLEMDTDKIICLPNVPSGIVAQYPNYPVCTEGCMLTGVNEFLRVSTFTIQPNPAIDYVHFSQAGTVQVFSSKGALALESEPNVEKLDISPLKPGIYIVIHTTPSGNSKTAKFIKL